MLLAKKQQIIGKMQRHSTFRHLIAKGGSKERLQRSKESKGLSAKEQSANLSSIVTKSVVVLGVLYIAMNVVLHYTQSNDK